MGVGCRLGHDGALQVQVTLDAAVRGGREGGREGGRGKSEVQVKREGIKGGREGGRGERNRTYPGRRSKFFSTILHSSVSDLPDAVLAVP